MRLNAEPAAVADRAPRLADGVRVESVSGALRLSRALARGRAHAWIARLVGAPDHATVELDAIGAWAVERFDGRTLGALAEDLAGHLKLTRREARIALGQFVQSLLQRRLATLAEPAAEPAR